MRKRDEAAWDRYRSLAAASIAAHGGRYVVRGGELEVAEGATSPDVQVVVVEFPSMDDVRTWYASPDYAEALAIRDAALERQLIFVQGLEEGEPPRSA